MEIQELSVAADKLQDKIRQYQEKLDDAKVKRQTTGEFTDPREYTEWRRIVRESTTQLHSVNRQIKDMRRSGARKSERNAAFVSAANQVLSKDQLTEITNLAQRLMTNESETSNQQ